MRRPVFAVVFVAAALAVIGCGKGPPPVAPPEPPVVTVEHPVERTLDTFLEFTGYLREVEKLRVMAQVTGYLKEITFAEGETVKVSRLILQHLHLEKRSSREMDFRKKFAAIYVEKFAMPQIFSTQLGYMLGNKLYYAVKKGLIPLREIRALFYESFDTPGHAFATYIRFIERLNHIRKPLSHEEPPRPFAASA